MNAAKRNEAMERLRKTKAAAANEGTVAGSIAPATETAAEKTPTTGREIADKAAATKTAKPKAAAAPKAEKPAKAAKPAAAPKAEKVEETNEAMLKRLKKEQPEKYGRVIEILERGKKGPTRVRIRCDDSTKSNVLTRDIKVQDLFQVRYSVEEQERRTKAARAQRTSDRRAAKAAAKKNEAPASE